MAATRAQGAAPAPRDTRSGAATPAAEPHPLHKALSSAAFAALLIVGLSVPIIALKTEQDINNQLILVQRWGLVGIFAVVTFGAAFGVSLQRGTLGRFLIVIGSFMAGIVGLRRAELSSFQLVALAGGAAALYVGGLLLNPNRVDKPLRAMIVGALPDERVMRWIGLGFMFAYPVLALTLAGNSGAIKWVDNFGVQILIYIMLGWGLNIVVGLAGLLDLGYVAFYAVGAYAYALIATKVIPATFPALGVWAFWICLPVAGALAALWGVILGFPVLRLRGDYLAIVTLAFGEIIRLVLINWVDFSNGYAGIETPRITLFGIPFSSSTGARTVSDVFGLTQSPTFYRSFFLYYVILVLALVTAVITSRLRRLPVGRAWEALREDEIACRSLGINTTNTKLTAFAIGAMFGGFAGAFFGARQGFVDPKSFEFMESATILAIVVLGGMGSLVGVALAAVVMIGGIEILRELDWLKQIFGKDFNPADYRMLLFGLGMVLMMIWKPRGFISTREPSLFLKEKRSISGSFVKEGHG